MRKGGERDYELRVRFGYRRTEEDQKAIVNATSTEALPDLLRAAIEDGRGAVAIRFGYFGTDRAGVMALVSAVHDEIYPPEEPEPAETPEGEDGETPPESPDGEAAEAFEAETGGEPETQPEEPETPPEAREGAGDETAETPPDEEEPDVPEEPAYDVSPWQVLFYPNENAPVIVEVILQETPKT